MSEGQLGQPHLFATLKADAIVNVLTMTPPPSPPFYVPLESEGVQGCEGVRSTVVGKTLLIV